MARYSIWYKCLRPFKNVDMFWSNLLLFSSVGRLRQLIYVLHSRFDIQDNRDITQPYVLYYALEKWYRWALISWLHSWLLHYLWKAEITGRLMFECTSTFDPENTPSPSCKFFLVIRREQNKKNLLCISVLTKLLLSQNHKVERTEGASA